MSGEKYECLPQFLSALAVSLCASVVGGWMSFTSVAIPKMMNNTAQSNLSAVLEYEDPITIDLHEGISWTGWGTRGPRLDRSVNKDTAQGAQRLPLSEL